MTARACGRSRRNGDGFTLVELLIVVTIIPVVIGALALGLITILSLHNGVATRITDAGDAQVVSSTFLRDVQSSALITEQPTLACGGAMGYTSPFQLLGLVWGGSGTSVAGYVNTVSYITVQNPGLNSYSLIRLFCTNGATAIATQSTTVATDLSAAGAVQLPQIQCSSSPVSGSTTACTSQLYLSGWIDSGDVKFIALSAQEHAPLPSPNNNVPFVLSLSAAPRSHLVSGSGATTTGGSAPLTVFGSASCATPALEITQNVTVSINVKGGTNNGTLALGPNCKSVQIDNGGALNAGSVFTTNPNLNSVYFSPSNATDTAIPEYYVKNITDPYSKLTPPSTTQDQLQPGSCSHTGSTWNCSAGYYTQDPGVQYFGNASNQTINFQTVNCVPDTPYPEHPCRFLFLNGLSLPGQSFDNFDSAVYVFEPNSSGVSFTGNPGVDINGAVTGNTQLLFYIASGSASFAPGLNIHMAGFQSLLGVTIWDADKTNPLVVGNNSSGGSSGSVAGYGGIYVPHEGVQINNNQVGTITVSFLAAEWLSFNQNLTINIIQP